MDTTTLIDHLRDARALTLSLFAEVEDADLIGPRLEIVNPPLWEVGHVGWFHERWILRHCGGREASIERADELYNSATIDHPDRWREVLPSRQRVLSYLAETEQDVYDTLRAGAGDPALDYFGQLSLYHEDMHVEALLYTRQTLASPRPSFLPKVPQRAAEATCEVEDVAVRGGRYQVGAERDAGFAFDNEKWQHEVELRDFRIASRPVSEVEFSEFVDDGGYERPELWCDEGWAWRQREAATQPVYWRRDPQGSWELREFDAWRAPRRDLPVVHVNWFEAQAWCRWADRRLPSEHEWEVTAQSEESREDGPAPNLDLRAGGCAPMGNPSREARCQGLLGDVWEWTACTFEPYAEFSMDPYREYSEPWFGSRKVLRGGSWASRERMLRTSLRNFFTPDRRDIWSGFRTCAP